MKKQYETPCVSVSLFRTENILTASGVGDNATNMANSMTTNGYTVTTQDLGSFFGTATE